MKIGPLFLCAELIPAPVFGVWASSAIGRPALTGKPGHSINAGQTLFSFKQAVQNSGITMQEFAEFESLFKREVEDKFNDLQRHGRLKHMIFGSQLNPELLERFWRMANMIRRLAKDRRGNDMLRKLLADKRAMLYFTQPSTRTFLSFMAACQILGVTCNEVRDPKTSSEVKRESKMDSIRMFSSYFDVIIIRSKQPRLAEACSYLMNQLEGQEMRSVPVVNAGSGADEHPTQALLDMYTIIRTFDFDESAVLRESRLSRLQEKYPALCAGPGNKTYLFCGDIGRGRTVRSLASVLSGYENVRMIFVAPDHDVLRLSDDLRARLADSGVKVVECQSLDHELDGVPVLKQADCVYMTRIQREHNSPDVTAEIDAIDMAPFFLTPERVALMKDFAPIMHPFPRDSVVGEIPTEIDSDPRAMYFRQARNGMWARAALLVHLFDAEDQLNTAHAKIFPGRTRV